MIVTWAITWDTPSCRGRRGCEAEINGLENGPRYKGRLTWGTPSHENTRNPQEIIKKNNSLQNEPGHVWRLAEASGDTKDDI